MLIYNFQKEFIGIDEADLEVFGFANLSELKAEASDFADMFVRTPGYIHNFKHVHWIDFITCADSSEESKVIIEVNGKTYKASVAIDTAYLSDNPTSKAYIVHLNNLRTLTLKENGEVSEDIARTKPPRMEPTVGHAFNLSKEDEQEIEAVPQLEGFKPFENIHETEKDLENLETSETLDIPQTPAILEEDNYETQDSTSIIPIDISFDDDDDIFAHEEEKAPIEVETPTIDIEDNFSLDSLSLDTPEEEDKSTPSTSETAVEEDDGFDYSYNYDPQVASDELGLPIDLIEEFIQDFIAQAKEFKDELYSSLDDGDLDNIKILSHKLKGVAANLRIEDAFNTLSIINTSSDISEVEKYLHIFYKIIAKLSGEEIVAPKAAVTTIEEPEKVQEDDDDLYHDDLILDFKPEESIIDAPEEEDEENDDDDLYHDFDISIKDSEVPEKIEMPELADDDFLNEEILETEQEIDTIDDLLLIDEEVDTNDSINIEIDFDVEEELDNEEIAIEEVNTSSSSEEEESTDLDELEEFNSKEDIQEPIEISYSKELIASEIGLDQESFNEIFDDYILDSQSLVATIQKAISEDDFTKCKKEGIKLKGMSENMRINTFKEELTSLINSSDKDELNKAVKKIDAAIAQISK